MLDYAYYETVFMETCRTYLIKFRISNFNLWFALLSCTVEVECGGESIMVISCYFRW